ncbi:MAG: LPXTG cell wall anchor domain-containing protein, partial [Firmicutes bacterium]|nr:LPXTG cell wall anchor domain-containing protein [Bacillota bacterium]
AENNTKVTFTNKKVPVSDNEGTLTIEKIVLDDDDEVIADDDSVFTFTVTNSDTNETVTIVGNDEETITLPVGNYTVAEIDIPDGFVDPVDSQNAEITVATNTKVTFTNKEKATIIINPPPANVDDEEGTLTITKKVVDNDGKDVPEDNSTFTFVVTNNNTNEKTTVTIKGNGTRKLTLFAGRYTVKEINIPKEYKQGLAAQVVDVEDDEDTPITFTNKLLAEIEVDPELPKTNAADMFMLGLGFLVTTGGLVLRRKRR